jgi:hypothetical protein
MGSILDNVKALPDDWEVLCNAGREAAKDLDKHRWLLGDIALLVETHYGENSIDEFAKEIGVSKKSVYRYRSVSGFWYSNEISQRGEILEKYPNLTYSHFADAIRLKNFEEALAWVETVSNNSWTVDEAAYKLSQRLGKALATTEKIVDCHIQVRGYELNQVNKPILDRVVVMLHPEAARALVDCGNTSLHMVIKKVSTT